MQIQQRRVEAFTHGFANFAGTGKGLACAIISILCWFAVGEKFNFSSRWEAAIEIYIGVITFLMIFIFQRAQKKEIAVLHLKLNELIASSSADNTIIAATEFTEEEIAELHDEHLEKADHEHTEA